MRDSDKIAIEEMAKEISAGLLKQGQNWRHVIVAEHLYTAGYRKQRTAEWVTTTETEDGVIQRYTHRCTDCNYFYKTVCPRGDDYCHKCGARMKGGE